MVAASDRAPPAPAAPDQLSPIELLLVGAIAGAGAKTLTAPVDRVLLIYQVSPFSTFSLRGAASLAADIARRAGTEGLWRGHTATLWRVVPFAGVQFCVFDGVRGVLTSRLLADAAPPWLPASAVAAASGAAAVCVATLATYPMDVLRTRMVSHVGPSPRYRNYTSAIDQILHAEGPSAFYRGLAPTLLGVVPYGALSFGMFDFLQARLRRHHGVATNEELPVAHRLAAGGVGGATAQLVLYPLEVVRRRMQARVPTSSHIGASVDELWEGVDREGRRHAAGGERDLGRYSSTRGALREILVTEGLARGLFKGVMLSWVKGPATVSLALVTNDVLKELIVRRRDVLERDQYLQLPGGQRVPGREGAPKQPRAIEGLVCGGLAGAVAKTVIAPGDRVKILFQTDPARHFTLRNAWRTGSTIFQEEGARALWRGHAATLIRVVPYSAISFSTFNPYKAYLREALPNSGDVTVRFMAGAAAGMTATAFTYPLDVLRARMAVGCGKRAAFDGYIRAVREIIRAEGVRALFSGMRPTLLGIMPYAGLSFSIFETMKAKVCESRQDSPQAALRAYERLAMGAVSGLLAQSATYPLDIVRRRMQTYPQQYRNEGQVIRAVLKETGVRGLFKGLSMNWIKGPVSISISFVVNDTLRDWVSHNRP